jgi:hypothetical protein
VFDPRLVQVAAEALHNGATSPARQLQHTGFPKRLYDRGTRGLH